MSGQIKNILDSILSKENDWKFQLLDIWPKMVGSLGTKMLLEKIQEDAITVGVYDPHWMQELFLMSNIIINKINKELKTTKIKKIKFKIVEASSTRSWDVYRTNKTQDADINNIKIDIRYQKILNTIVDNELKNCMEKYLKICINNENN